MGSLANFAFGTVTSACANVRILVLLKVMVSTVPSTLGCQNPISNGKRLFCNDDDTAK